MKSTIKIPDKIRVGYQKRSDTYTSQLAYVIYYDNKGKLHKEKSFEDWRDERIEPNEFENKPMEGFVLNKKVGGCSSGWNHRQTYVRVYDPREFEFEISVANLLFILENTNSIKGKGLEGKFIYGWNGKDLVLIPCDSPDYVKISKYNDMVKTGNKYKGSDLKVGGIYLDKENKEVVYMGRFDYHGRKKQKKAYYFYNREKRHSWYDKVGYFIEVSSVGNYIIDTIDDKCVDDYADIFSKLEYYEVYNPYDPSKDEYINHTFESFEKYFKLSIEKDVCLSWERIQFFYKNGTRLKDRWNYLSSDINIKYNKNTQEFSSEYFDIGGLSLKEIFNTVKPQYKKEYLADGKLRKVRYYE